MHVYIKKMKGSRKRVVVVREEERKERGGMMSLETENTQVWKMRGGRVTAGGKDGVSGRASSNRKKP